MTAQLAISFAEPSSGRDMICEVVACKPDLFRAEFYLWLQDNFEIWKAFEAEANRIWQRGRAHYSARTIAEYLRHETALRQAGGEFKLNNNVVPDLARLYSLMWPERRGLFEFREHKAAA